MVRIILIIRMLYTNYIQNKLIILNKKEDLRARNKEFNKKL